MSLLLVRGARQLLTLRSPGGPRRGSALRDLHLIPDGAVLVRNGVIEEVGPGRRVENLAASRGAEEVDATGRVVMPAFVDLETSLVHAHPSAESLDRLLANSDPPDDAALREVLENGARLLSGLSSNALRRRASRIMRDMLSHGTGTVESRAGYALGETDLFKVLRVQTEDRGEPIDVTSTLLLKAECGGDPVEWARWVTGDLLPKVRKRNMASFVDLEFDQEALPVPIAIRILQLAAELGLQIKVHAEYLAVSSAIPLAVRSGAVTVANFRRVTDSDVHLLAESSVIAVFKPGFLLQAGTEFAAPCRRMIDAGVIPALGSGYHAELSSSYNAQLMLMLACRLYRMTPEEAIVSATINAAYAVRANCSVGSIEAGKQADILVLNISDYREVAYYSGVNYVDKVIKRGRLIYPADWDIP